MKRLGSELLKDPSGRISRSAASGSVDDSSIQSDLESSESSDSSDSSDVSTCTFWLERVLQERFCYVS